MIVRYFFFKFARNIDDWEIPSNKVVLLEELGEGAFGKVWKGFIRRKDISNKMEVGQLAESGGNSVLGLQKETADQSMMVAVKTLHSGKL